MSGAAEEREKPPRMKLIRVMQQSPPRKRPQSTDQRWDRDTPTKELQMRVSPTKQRHRHQFTNFLLAKHVSSGNEDLMDSAMSDITTTMSPPPMHRALSSTYRRAGMADIPGRPMSSAESVHLQKVSNSPDFYMSSTRRAHAANDTSAFDVDKSKFRVRKELQDYGEKKHWCKPILRGF
jgi:hypothetical protein